MPAVFYAAIDAAAMMPPQPLPRCLTCRHDTIDAYATLIERQRAAMSTLAPRFAIIAAISPMLSR